MLLNETLGGTMVQLTQHAKERLAERFGITAPAEYHLVEKALADPTRYIQIKKPSSDIRECKLNKMVFQAVIKEDRVVTVLPPIHAQEDGLDDVRMYEKTIRELQDQVQRLEKTLDNKKDRIDKLVENNMSLFEKLQLVQDQNKDIKRLSDAYGYVYESYREMYPKVKDVQRKRGLALWRAVLSIRKSEVPRTPRRVKYKWVRLL